MSTSRGVAKGQIFPHHAYMTEAQGSSGSTEAGRAAGGDPAEAARAAFAQGDFGLARRLARSLPPESAAEILDRLAPDRLIGLLILGCMLLYTIVVYFTLH